MRQKIKTVSAALMIGFVSFFLSFSVHINGTDVQPQADRAGTLSFEDAGSENLRGNEAGFETGLPVLVSWSGRTTGNVQRLLTFAMAAMAFVFCVRKKRAGSVWVRRMEAPSSRFLHELLIRLKKDGKKRRCSFEG